MVDQISEDTRMGKLFEMRWVPGHKGLQGNELVDEGPKKAAERKQGGALEIPKELEEIVRGGNLSALRPRVNTDQRFFKGNEYAFNCTDNPRNPVLLRFLVLLTMTNQGMSVQSGQGESSGSNGLKIAEVGEIQDDSERISLTSSSMAAIVGINLRPECLPSMTNGLTTNAATTNGLATNTTTTDAATTNELTTNAATTNAATTNAATTNAATTNTATTNAVTPRSIPTIDSRVSVVHGDIRDVENGVTNSRNTILLVPSPRFVYPPPMNVLLSNQLDGGPASWAKYLCRVLALVLLIMLVMVILGTLYRFGTLFYPK
ncbi:hypothetical protein K435DRAFT_867767 [Dendrothele bispora CBS 962.96]|uniref:RNase H type-1 domain-containing protein n=1 Tax=Dendrothele bispora (strain CBS 962.96) TaxID=1314807 RepID=A0A4S8LDT4_DENBC|nr:hypothetical protein K435DRAFT_867767 [Dendrothele bispora CBS 962.96]